MFGNFWHIWANFSRDPTNWSPFIVYREWRPKKLIPIRCLKGMRTQQDGPHCHVQGMETWQVGPLWLRERIGDLTICSPFIAKKTLRIAGKYKDLKKKKEIYLKILIERSSEWFTPTVLPLGIINYLCIFQRAHLFYINVVSIILAIWYQIESGFQVNVLWNRPAPPLIILFVVCKSAHSKLHGTAFELCSCNLEQFYIILVLELDTEHTEQKKANKQGCVLVTGGSSFSCRSNRESMRLYGFYCSNDIRWSDALK